MDSESEIGESSKPSIVYSFKPLNPVKQRYRRFLDETMINFELTKFLFKLVEETEKPQYLIHYFKQYFGEETEDIPNSYKLQEELTKEKITLKALQKKNHELKEALRKVEQHWDLQPFIYR